MAHTKKEEWKERVWRPSLQRNQERQEHFATSSGIEVEVLYTPDDTADLDYARDLGYPGSFPFTRGIYPTMYRGRLWTMRQVAGFASTEETNRRFRYLLAQGQTGLSMEFDLPTQIGYDSDHPVAYPEVGKVGMPISHLEDMALVLEGIDLGQVSTSMTINATAVILLAYYIAVAKRQGVSTKSLRGTIQNDILKEYIARGTYIFPPEPSMRLVTDLMAYCATEAPSWNTISFGGYHLREAGASASQEIGFTFASAIAYAEAALEAGLKVDDFAPQFSFFMAARSDLLEEVAKFRAARRLWARLMRDRFGAQDPRSMMFRFHTQTAGVTLTAQQPDNNVIRSTLQALVAILGGTQSLHVNSKDEAFALPTEETATVSLRTQQILAYECGLTDTVDPLAGSYYIEAMTDRLEQEARRHIQEIDSLGGAVRAIELGYYQRNLAEASYRFQTEIETGKRIVVGVNAFTSQDQRPLRILRIDPEGRKSQIARLQDLRKRRDGAVVQTALDDLERVARSSENIMPAVLACADALCTTGEISNVLRKVFSTYQERVVF